MNTGKSLKRDFMRYIIPSVMAQWIFTLYTMVDGMFVALGVNEVALTAVNLSFPFLACLFSLSLLFAVGTSTIVGILLGGKRKLEACEIFTQNIVLQIILSVIIAVLVMLNLESLAHFLGAPDEKTLNYVIQYISWIAPFSCVYLLSYSFEILLKTDGYPQKATMVVIFGAVANCILDWLFVIVLKKGIAGAAFATSLSQAAVIVLYLQHFFSGKGVLHFKRFKPNAGIIIRQIKNGFSSGITELSSGMVTFIYNHTILIYLNPDALVSYTIVSYVNSIVVLSATGIAQGSQPLISYYYGKDRIDQCKKLLKYCVISAGTLCISAFIICFFTACGIVNIYIGPELQALRDYSVTAFRIFITSFLFVGFNIAISGYFTSIEFAWQAAIISVGRGFILMIGSLMVMTRLFGGSGIWWSPVVSEGVCLIITVILFAGYIKTRHINRNVSIMK